MYNITVPGGTVTVRPASDLSVKHTRPLQLRVLMFGSARFAAVLHDPSPTTEGLDPAIGFTAADEAAVEGIADAAVWAVLDSWTLPLPVPESPAAVGALPEHVREDVAEATRGECARLLRRVLG